MLRTHPDPTIAAGRPNGAAPGLPRPDRWLAYLRDAAVAVKRWRDRRRSRRALAELDDDLLKDIGLTRAEARRESAKPFWNP